MYIMMKNKLNCSSLNKQQFQPSKTQAIMTLLLRRLKTYCFILLKYVIDYCNNSSLHGLKYIFNTKLALIERFFWLLLFLASLVAVILLSFFGIYQIWRDSPSLIVYDSHLSPIGSVPFPSITVCPYFSIKKSYIDLASTNDSLMLFYATYACPVLNGSSLKYTNVTFTNDLFYHIQKSAPTCPELFKKCSWKNTVIDCCTLFHPVFTDVGLCYNFNMLPVDKLLQKNTFTVFPSLKYPPETVFWDEKTGYPQFDDVFQTPVLPYKVESGGLHNSLSIELFQDLSEWQEYCSGAYSGFEIFINSPFALPIFSHDAVPIEMNKEIVLMISPNVLSSFDNICNIESTKRDCLFHDEMSLQFFRSYSFQNCMHECISVLQVQECGCVPFFMPRNKTTKICSSPKEEVCIFSSIKRPINYAVNRSAKEENIRKLQRKCNCLPQCSEISFMVEKYYSDFLHIDGFEPPWSKERLRMDQVTKVKIHYKNGIFLAKKRKLRYTLLSFIGKCGGLLSLFLGFSFISAFEIIYFLLIRPFSKILHSKNQVFPTKINVKVAPATIQFLH